MPKSFKVRPSKGVKMAPKKGKMKSCTTKSRKKAY